MSATTLTAVTLAAIQSLAGPQSAPEDRLRALAADIAYASELAESPLPSALHRAMALVAIARTESDRYRASVLSCVVRGRLGEVTAFQLMPGHWLRVPVRDLCPTNAMAAWTALRILDRPCGRRSVAAMFRGYAAGPCNVQSDVAKIQLATYQALLKRYSK